MRICIPEHSFVVLFMCFEAFPFCSEALSFASVVPATVLLSLCVQSSSSNPIPWISHPAVTFHEQLNLLRAYVKPVKYICSYQQKISFVLHKNQLLLCLEIIYICKSWPCKAGSSSPLCWQASREGWDPTRWWLALDPCTTPTPLPTDPTTWAQVKM